jgi:hypothetical protein
MRCVMRYMIRVYYLRFIDVVLLMSFAALMDMFVIQVYKSCEPLTDKNLANKT